MYQLKRNPITTLFVRTFYDDENAMYLYQNGSHSLISTLNVANATEK